LVPADEYVLAFICPEHGCSCALVNLTNDSTVLKTMKLKALPGEKLRIFLMIKSHCIPEHYKASFHEKVAKLCSHPPRCKVITIKKNPIF